MMLDQVSLETYPEDKVDKNYLSTGSGTLDMFLLRMLHERCLQYSSSQVRMLHMYQNFEHLLL